MKKNLTTLIVCHFIFIIAASAQCFTNILTNPGFDSPIQPGNGNNILNSFSFNGWTMTGGQGFNIVQPNGSYGAGPNNAQDGTQYVEVAFGNGTVYQDFIISAPGTNISYGGYFSSRTGGAWSTTIKIYTMPGNLLISTSNILQYSGQGTKVWLYCHGNTTLNTGNYRFEANIPDDANFDASFLYANCNLPIHLISFSASLQASNSASLQWKIATTEDGGKYELQRSSDGRNFSGINLQTGNSFVTQFNYTDNTLPNGTYYYRLKMTDKDGKVTYSNVAIVKVGSKEHLVSVYPNPVQRGKSLQLSLQNIIANKIEIINSTGQVVHSNVAKQTGSISIPISSSLASGQYVVRTISDNKIYVQKILIQ